MSDQIDDINAFAAVTTRPAVLYGSKLNPVVDHDKFVLSAMASTTAEIGAGTTGALVDPVGLLAALGTATPTALTGAIQSIATNIPANNEFFIAAVGGDMTAVIQAALDLGKWVKLGAGVCSYTQLVLKRNSRLRGFGRKTLLRQSGTLSPSIYVADASGTEPDGTAAYTNSGWVGVQDLELEVRGLKGIELGNARSSLSTLNGLYIRHFDEDTLPYAVGAVAISCDNAPWASSKSTYVEMIRNVSIRGFETGISLNAVVTEWDISGVYMLQCKNQISLNDTGRVSVRGYFESNISACRGVIFGASGGNHTRVDGSFEFNNVAGNSYAFDFSAAGVWAMIDTRGSKYLIQGDGGALVGRKWIGTPPSSFVASYVYTRGDAQQHMIEWQPGSTLEQKGVVHRLGGNLLANGELLLGRSDNDSSDVSLKHNGTSALLIKTPGGAITLTDSGSAKAFEIAPNSGALSLRNGGSASNGPVGYFAMTATATKVITNSAATPNSYIYLTPYNASGGALMGGAKSLYISVFGTGSFTVATADASNAAGTEGIQYLIIN